MMEKNDKQISNIFLDQFASHFSSIRFELNLIEYESNSNGF
jgi:hypothetical protein